MAMVAILNNLTVSSSWPLSWGHPVEADHNNQTSTRVQQSLFGAVTEVHFCGAVGAGGGRGGDVNWLTYY